MPADIELATQIIQTRAFIKADATILVLEHFDKIGDGAGGFVFRPAGADGVEVRMIPQTDQNATSELSSSEGRITRRQYIMLAEPGVPVKRYDQFEFDGDRWQVTAIVSAPPYEIKAEVNKHGG